jgi:hypothetical protein
LDSFEHLLSKLYNSFHKEHQTKPYLVQPVVHFATFAAHIDAAVLLTFSYRRPLTHGLFLFFSVLFLQQLQL